MMREGEESKSDQVSNPPDCPLAPPIITSLSGDGSGVDLCRSLHHR